MGWVNNVSIKMKIIVSLLVVGILPLTLITSAIYQTSKQLLIERAFEHLTSVKEIKGEQVESYFTVIEHQIQTLSESQMIIDATVGFKQAFDEVKQSHQQQPINSGLREYYLNEFIPRLNNDAQTQTAMDAFFPTDPVTIAMQAQYISNNPYATGEKDKLNRAVGTERYHNIHAQYHPIFKSYLNKFGYYDIFILDKDTGYIIYSVFKEVDFATSIISGPYKNTHFAKAFNKSLAAENNQFAYLQDFEPYAPSYFSPASFISAPIFDGETMIGVLVFQMPVESINRIVTAGGEWNKQGLGKTGESYLVAADGKMRSISRGFIQNKSSFLETLAGRNRTNEAQQISRLNTTIGTLSIDTPAIKSALLGNNLTESGVNYLGIPTLTSYRPLNINHVNYALITEIQEREILAPLKELRNYVFFFFALALLAIIAITIFLTRSITQPITNLSDRLSEVVKGDGDLSQQLIAEHNDEMGHVANQFNQFTDKIKNVIRAVSVNSLSLHKSSKELTSASETLSSGAGLMAEKSATTATAIEALNNNLCKLLTNTKDISDSMFTAAENTNSMSDLMQAMSNQAQATQRSTSSITDTVKAMNENILSIADNSENAKLTCNQAVEQVSAAQLRVNELGKSSSEISQITRLIAELANQTKLLALNAAIEASCAGDSGKGFSVVAAEIKELATRTNKANAEIQNKIVAIQTDSEKTNAEIEKVNLIIHRVNNMVAGIALAIDKQLSSTNTIASNITDASRGIDKTTHMVESTQSSVVTLDTSIRLTSELTDRINQMLQDIATSASEITEEVLAVDHESKVLKHQAKVLDANANDIRAMGKQQKETIKQFKI